MTGSALQDGIAIVGMSGRFPGASDVKQFWRNLCNSVESITRFGADELEDAFAPEIRAQPAYVRARAILRNVDLFDASFFGISARDAELIDPQHRLFLECCWEALEDAGYDPAAYAGRIGVFAGCTINTYLLRHVLADRDAVERFTTDYQVGSYPELLGAGQDFLATRVAYKLDLRGPAATIQSACSTSLVTVAQACQALASGQADMMLAGAVSISFPQKRGYLHQAGGMVSADGHCRTFDAQASGTVFGDGAGVVVLKRLADALAARDTIYAVIRGFGVNNDGSGKAGYTAPGAAGQAAAIAAAHEMAGFDARSVRFVECHGTATPLGDPIEFAALARVFPATEAGAYCTLGSVKTNIGHLDVAAGMSGLIKTALTLAHRQIPPTLHYAAPNPRIAIGGSAFAINTTLIDWPRDDPQPRAGVSSFGVGGTNAHLALEAAPRGRPAASFVGGEQLLVLSARSPAALEAQRCRLIAHLTANPHLGLADVAFTLQAGRRAFAHRVAVTARDVPAAIVALSNAGSGRQMQTADVAFMFPGQGAQYAGMGRDLYRRRPVFRAALERCAAILQPLSGVDLCAVLFDADAGGTGAAALASTQFAQPALFAIEYALAQLWLHLGIRPAAMIGHSVGEFVAATLAGVFSLDDALTLVAERGRLMQALPLGAMLAVRLDEAELCARLDPRLSLAAVNSPRLTVAAGPLHAVAALEHALTRDGIACRRLATLHAFHSAMVDEMLAPLLARLRAIPLAEPSLPYISGLTGDWVTPQQATSPEYWARHCRATIRFETGVRTIAAAGIGAFLEVGPGTALATCVRQTLGAQGTSTIAASLPSAQRERTDDSTLLAALGRLWSLGLTPDWQRLHDGQAPSRIALPTYPFERRRHWIDAPAPAPALVPVATAPNAAPVLPPPAASARLERSPLNAAKSAPAEPAVARAGELERSLLALLEELSGETLTAADCATSFLELGFDSLFLGRFVQKLGSVFATPVTFRALMTDLPTVAALAAHIAATLPPAQTAAAACESPPTFASPPVDEVTLSAPLAAQTSRVVTNVDRPASSSLLQAVVSEQLAVMQQLMRDQLQAIGAASGSTPSASLPAAPATAAVSTSRTASAGSPASAASGVSAASNADAQPVGELPPVGELRPAVDAPSRFDVYRAAGAPPRGDASPEQRAHIADLVERTVARTPRSKALTARYRGVLADPRVAAGFRAEWKEMVYPIVCATAQGSQLTDIDGNDYIDILNGFGQTAFGHAPDFVVAAVEAQLRDGFAIGPQTPLAGDVAELFCELTGNERVTFCNTGSEAVMAALRVARTVTGRDRVVMFSGAYHGQFDEVLVKSARTPGRALPVAPGIPTESVANMVVLPYADRASLEWVREHAAELAAVVVEPVQSRHPDVAPREFLTEIRAITQATGTAFIMDEVVTGFRMHPGGMQAVFGIRADMATYGKVVGGGLPIGILGGSRRFMDALDGGAWHYGDDSAPDVPPTFFAGTFVRHPLVMAAVLAVLRHLKDAGPALQADLSARTAALVARLNECLAERAIASRIECYGSLFYCSFAAEERLSALLYYHLRLRGIYVQEGFPCFLTTAHTSANCDAIVAAFAQSLDELQAVGIFGTAPTAPRDLTLTEGQTEIWLAAQLSDDASCAFNESITLDLNGQLDERAFAQAWSALVARHDALRTTFRPTGESMHVRRSAAFPLQRSDSSAHDARTAATGLARAIALDARTPFDLIAGPLVRGHLVRLAAAHHAFIFTAHHIICDGWSINVLLEEFAALYAALQAGVPSALPEPLAFSSYAAARQKRDAAELVRIEAFWLAQFAAPVTPLELPLDRPRPVVRSYQGATASVTLDRERYRAVKRAGAGRGCTLFVTLLAAFGALIGRLGRTRDVVIGVPAAGQALLDNAILVGHCVDLLPLRARWAADTTLDELLARLKTHVLAAYDHQDYTLGTLVRTLAPIRETNRVPLADIQFNLERLSATLALPDLAVSAVPNAKACVNFDLFVNVIESDAGLRIDCDYNTGLFDQSTVDGWLGAYCALLDTLVADLTQTVDAAGLRSLPAPAAAVAVSGALAPVDYLREETLTSLFAAQVAQRPSALAATCGETALTYAELDTRVTALAGLLRARFGPRGGRIGICLSRSLDLLVALLATLKAGFAYVPLDPTHPAARLRLILADAGVVAVLGDADFDSTILGAASPVVPVSAELSAAAETAPAVAALPVLDPETAAYVIYTSGSTGTPKGVEITHRSLVNLLTSMAREPGFTADDTLLAVTTVAFDIAGLELYLPLVTGGIVVIATDSETRDGNLLLGRLERSGATALQATPATWRMLLETAFRPASTFKIICGGEALRRDLADRLLALGADVWNMYGPTETTIWSSCVRVTSGGPITVGRPIANTTFVILDGEDRPVPAGETGQLHIGGDGLARGYWNRPKLSAEKFIANPFGPGRLYRTGDTARMLENGQFEILGRLDEQVKLRGYRIELGEIEATLGQHGAVEALTVVLQESMARLVAYYIERADLPVTPGELQALAAKHLPDYMLPSVWIKLAAFPLNSNGKIDRAALPAPPAQDTAADSFGAAQTPTERALAEIWADVLQREQIGTNDDIFGLGADSIQIFAMTARANRRGLPLLAKNVMKHRTISALAAALDRAAESLETPPPQPLTKAARPPLKAGVGDRHYAPRA